MSINEIHDTLNEQVENNVLTLTADVFNSAVIAALLNDHFPQNALTITDPDIELVGDAVVVSGRTTFFGSKPLLTSATFGEEADEVQLTLTARLVETAVALDLNTMLTALHPEHFGLPEAALADLRAAAVDLRFADVEIGFTPQTETFTLNGRTADVWSLPIGHDGINLHTVALSLERDLSAEDGALTGSLSGTLTVGTASLTATYNFPGDFVLTAQVPALNLSTLLQDLVGGDMVRGLAMPHSALNMTFSDVSATIAPQQRFFSLAAASPLGQSQLVIKQSTETEEWGFGAAFLPPAAGKQPHRRRF